MGNRDFRSTAGVGVGHRAIGYPCQAGIAARFGFQRPPFEEAFGYSVHGTIDVVVDLILVLARQDHDALDRAVCFPHRPAQDFLLRLADTPGRDLEERLSQICRWVLEAEAAGMRYGLELPDHPGTLAQWIEVQLRRPPVVGDRLAWGGAHFSVRQMDGAQVLRVGLSLGPPG